MSASDNPPSPPCHIDYLQSAVAGLHVFTGRQSEYQRDALLAAAAAAACLAGLPQTEAIRREASARLAEGWKCGIGGVVVVGGAGRLPGRRQMSEGSARQQLRRGLGDACKIGSAIF